MTITAEDITNFFPEFASLQATVVEQWLDFATVHHNACAWGGKSDEGLRWLTAHFLAAFASGPCGTGKDLGPGPLTATAEGRTSASWSPLTVPKVFTKDDLGTTKYGRRYLSMVETLFVCRCT